MDGPLESFTPSTVGSRSRVASSVYPGTPALSVMSPMSVRRRGGRMFRSTKIDREQIANLRRHF